MPFQVTKDPVNRCCCVPICENKKFNLTHKFPGNEQKCDEWLLALDIPKLYNVPRQKLLRSYFICTRHFRDQDYKYSTSRYLNITAIPSLNIKDLSQLDLVVSRWKADDSKFEEEKSNINQNFNKINEKINKNINDNITEENETLFECESDVLTSPIYIEIDHDIAIEQKSSPIQRLNRNILSKSRFTSQNNVKSKCKKPKMDIEIDFKKNCGEDSIEKDIEEQLTMPDENDEEGTDGKLEIISDEEKSDEYKSDDMST